MCSPLSSGCKQLGKQKRATAGTCRTKSPCQQLEKAKEILYVLRQETCIYPCPRCVASACARNVFHIDHVLVLHPYYKLNYIKIAWGGEEEQAAEIRASNADAKNWQQEAQGIIEAAVGGSLRLDPRV
jgi:hypothetical protein